MTNTQKIEASRELRLWINQVLLPTVATVAALGTVPEIRQKAADIYWNVKNKIVTIVNK